MKAYELRRLLKETGEAANDLINAFQKMADNEDEKRERALLEKIKQALFDYKAKRDYCKKNGLMVVISIDPAAIQITIENPPFEVQLTPKDLKILHEMKISIEEF